MSSKYPTRDEIESLCSHLATSDPSKFFDRVSPDVEWDVMGMILVATLVSGFIDFHKEFH